MEGDNKINWFDEEFCKEFKWFIIIDFFIRCCFDGKLVWKWIWFVVIFFFSGEFNIGNIVFFVCCFDGKEENGIFCCLEVRSIDNDEIICFFENE